MNHLLLPSVALALTATAVQAGGTACLAAAQDAAPQVVSTPAPSSAAPGAIDLAICLDVSGSMEGLIDSARQKIWAIVNDLARAEPAPQLRVALLTFGCDAYDPSAGWVRVDTDLTGDLDLISEKLFALRTNGGTELVGRVLGAAQHLNWSSAPGSLKLAMVAGNESADQDQTLRYTTVCSSLIAQDIIVNSIYCGDPAHADAPGWQDVARRADGMFAAIDKDNGTLVIETPFDAQIAELNTALNTTYIPYGVSGQQKASQQWAQDSNAAAANSQTLAERAQVKACGVYCNSGWDLVDAVKQPEFTMATVEVAQLPEIMQHMTEAERVAYVAGKAAERSAIQRRITAVAQEREAFIVAERSRLALDDDRAFDVAVRRAIREQAGARGFRFPALALTAETSPVAAPAAATPGSGT